MLLEKAKKTLEEYKIFIEFLLKIIAMIIF
jgi:hypothetical protein